MLTLKMIKDYLKFMRNKPWIIENEMDNKSKITEENTYNESNKNI